MTRPDARFDARIAAGKTAESESQARCEAGLLALGNADVVSPIEHARLLDDDLPCADHIDEAVVPVASVDKHDGVRQFERLVRDPVPLFEVLPGIDRRQPVLLRRCRLGHIHALCGLATLERRRGSEGRQGGCLRSFERYVR